VREQPSPERCVGATLGQAASAFKEQKRVVSGLGEREERADALIDALFLDGNAANRRATGTPNDTSLLARDDRQRS
jgi:hypothetical protein